MIDLLLEAAGLVLLAVFLVLTLHVWGVLAAGGLLVVAGNVHTVVAVARARGERR